MALGFNTFAEQPFSTVKPILYVQPTGVELNIGTEPAAAIPFTAYNDAQLSTAQFKFGTSSLLLDGTNDYVESNSNIDLSSTNFTIDLWIRPTSVSGYKGIWESGTSNKLVSYLLGNTVYLSVGGSTIISSSVTVNANEWTMLSYEREGSTHRIYKNGTLEDTSTAAQRPDNGPFSVGENLFGDFNGYIDEVRLSTVARYTGSDFTQPTIPFVSDGSTVVLLHFDGTNGSTTITNSATQGINIIGNANVGVNTNIITVAVGDVTIFGNATVVLSGEAFEIGTSEARSATWSNLPPGATQTWTRITTP